MRHISAVRDILVLHKKGKKHIVEESAKFKKILKKEIINKQNKWKCPFNAMKLKWVLKMA